VLGVTGGRRANRKSRETHDGVPKWQCACAAWLHSIMRFMWPRRTREFLRRLWWVRRSSHSDSRYVVGRDVSMLSEYTYTEIIGNVSGARGAEVSWIVDVRRGGTRMHSRAREATGKRARDALETRGRDRYIRDKT
jgi:hypothetical protein